MSVESDESTPLLRGTSKPLNKYKKTYHIYVSSLGVLFLLALFTSWFRDTLPRALSEVQARKVDGFPGTHAYDEYLTRFTAPHPPNSHENGAMRDWLASIVTGFQKDATERGVQMDVIGHDDSVNTLQLNWFTPDEHWYLESRNVVVRINGTSGKEDALLVNAHYDSVPTSHGVVDNGMSVVTAIESIRYFIDHPPRHSVIFLFNNFEEGGLLGAKTFIHHPWYRNVKAFLNLEGSGIGGRVLLFRSTSLASVKQYANSKAGFKHANAIGNDIMNLNLIKSDTDYSVFINSGVPGTDIAFYDPRSHYHTSRDDLAHTTPEALQYMGEVALNAIKEIINSDDLVNSDKEHTTFVYYDILGRIMFTFSMTTYQITNLLALFIVPVAGFALAIANKNTEKSASSIIKEKVCLTILGSAAVFVALIFSIIFIGASVFVITKVNPSMSYGDVYGAALYVFAAGFLGLQFSQLILPNKMKQTLAQTDAAWYGLITFWWSFVALALYLSTKKFTSLYFAIYILAFNSLALLAHKTISSEQKLRSATIYYIQIVVPAIMLFEFEFLCMDTLRHITADGVPEFAVYVFLSYPITLLVLHFLPWVHIAGNNRRMTIVSAVAFVFLFSICSALQPFNDAWSPNKLVFRQEYNVGDAFATVSVSTATGIHSILKKTISSKEYDTLQCEPFRTYLTRCTYQTELLPKYGSNNTLIQEFVLSEIEKSCNGDVCTASGSYKSKNSLMCRVMFKAEETHETTQKVSIKGQDIKHENIGAVITYVDKYDEDVNFSFEYAKENPPKVEFGCFYDEWTKLEIPAFSAFQNHLPDDALAVIRGHGLAYVNYNNVTL